MRRAFGMPYDGTDDQTRARLARFGILTRRFAANLRRCNAATFLAMGGVYVELGAVEKRLDGYIDALRREDLREIDCGHDVDGFIAQAAHLAERSFGESDLDYPEQQVGLLTTLDLDLDTFLAGVGFAKQTLATLAKSGRVEPAEADVDAEIYGPLQQLIDQARSAQALARKMLRRSTELAAQTAAIAPTSIEPVAEVGRSVRALASAAIKLAALVGRYAAEVRTTNEGALAVATVLDIAHEAASDLGLKSANTLAALDTDITLALSRLQSALAIVLAPEHVIKAAHTAPWLDRVAEMASAAAVGIEAERRAGKLNDELRELRKDLRTRDAALQEGAVKIELMDKRMEAVKRQADAAAELETELAKAKKQERTYEEAIEALQADLDAMEADLVKAKAAAPAVPVPGKGAP